MHHAQHGAQTRLLFWRGTDFSGRSPTATEVKAEEQAHQRCDGESGAPMSTGWWEKNSAEVAFQAVPSEGRGGVFRRRR